MENEQNFERESGNSAKIDIKKSSSTGKTGYDISIKCDGKINQQELDRLGEMALKTALKVQEVLTNSGV